MTDSPGRLESGAETLQVEARVHGRVLVQSGPPSGPLVVGFHGYGETAEAMLTTLRAIPGAEGRSLAAVQALHPFYRSRTGEVVASWMTRLDRTLAIDDNVAYAAAAISAARRATGAEGPLFCVGFSQGVAMAFRAAARSGHRCAGVVANGADVPPELSEEDLAQIPSALLARGRRDPAYPEAQALQDAERLKLAGVGILLQRFDGGHEWTADLLATVGEFFGCHS